MDKVPCEVGKNHIQFQTACDPSQVSRAFWNFNWQDNGHATPAKFEFSVKLITITCNFQLQQRQSEVGNNHIQIQTACDPSQVSRAFLGRLTVYCISVNSDL